MSVVPSSPRYRNTDRIPPRRRKRRKRLLKNFILPLFGRGLVCVIALTVVFAVCNKIIRPFRLCSVGGYETRKIEKELHALEEQNAALQRQIKYIETPEGIAQAARKLGYVKPGEVTLVINETRKR